MSQFAQGLDVNAPVLLTENEAWATAPSVNLLFVSIAEWRFMG